jgi:hypothetical protein
MRTRILAATVAATLAALLVPLLASPAAAHQEKTVGKYHFVVGFGDEPAYAGEKNSVQLILADANDKPVTDLTNTLKVEVTTGDAQPLALPMEPNFEVGEFGTPEDRPDLQVRAPVVLRDRRPGAGPVPGQAAHRRAAGHPGRPRHRPRRRHPDRRTGSGPRRRILGPDAGHRRPGRRRPRPGGRRDRTGPEPAEPGPDGVRVPPLSANCQVDPRSGQGRLASIAIPGSTGATE